MERMLKKFGRVIVLMLFCFGITSWSIASEPFQMGWWDTFVSPDVERLASEGATIALANYTGASVSEVNQWLYDAQACGLKVIAEVPKDAFLDKDTAAIQDFVQIFDSHPAVIGWQIGDEPGDAGSTHDTFITAYNAIKTVSSKPVSMVLYQTGNITPYADCYDLLLFDQYVCHQGEAEFETMPGYKDVINQASANVASVNKPWWMVTQAFGQPTGSARLPTPNESRFMAYWAFHEGAESVLDYSRYLISGTGPGPTDPYTGDGDQWIGDAFTPLANEIKQCGAALGAGAMLGLADNNSALQSSLYQDPDTGKYYVLAINSGTGGLAVNFDLTLGGNLTRAIPLNGGSAIDIADGQFSDSFDSYGVRVYELATDPPAVHYTFKETAPGTWEVLVEVTGGDTAGLSAYEIWVDGVDPESVSYAENILGTVYSTPVGFSSGTLVQGEVVGSFNAGNYQGSGDAAIEGIGMVEIDELGGVPGMTPHVDLDAQALLGILTTEAGLTEANFRAIVAGLLNETGDGFYDADGLVPTWDVIQFVPGWIDGDANHDGVVSAGDYASVQANFGNVGDGILGDANGDGVVSAGDYASVQANFGNTASTSTVPEPASIAMLALGLCGVIRHRRKS